MQPTAISSYKPFRPDFCLLIFMEFLFKEFRNYSRILISSNIHNKTKYYALEKKILFFCSKNNIEIIIVQKLSTTFHFL